MLPDFDPYVVLGVDKDSSASEIKSAYRKLALKCHPDKIKDESLRTKAVDDFQRVQESYEILSDDSRRQMYNQEVHLENLRNEIKAQRSSTDGYSASRGASSREFRDGRMYEERVPADAAFFTDSDEPHYFDEPTSYSHSSKYSESAKRPHTKVTEERKKTKATTYATPSPRATKQSDRESTRATHNSRDKIRTKERRRDASNKHEQAFVLSDTEDFSDSDLYWNKTKTYESDPRYSVPPRTKMDSIPPYASQPRKFPSDSESELSFSEDDYHHSGSKLNSQENFLKEYISRNRDPVIQVDRRPRTSKYSSHEDRDRRHSERSDRDSPRHTTRSYSKPENVYVTESASFHHTSSRRSHERLGSPTRGYERERERTTPSMPAKSSSYRSSSSRAPPPVTRAATAPYPTRTRQSSSRSESNTLSSLGSMVAGITGLKADTVLPSRSRPRGADRNDSGYSSGPSTPEMPQGFSGKINRYKIVEKPDTDRDTITVEHIDSRYRNSSPPLPRVDRDRERSSTSSRSRMHTYEPDPYEPEIRTVRPAAVSSKSTSSAHPLYREVKPPSVFYEKRYRQAVH